MVHPMASACSWPYVQPLQKLLQDILVSTTLLERGRNAVDTLAGVLHRELAVFVDSEVATERLGFYEDEADAADHEVVDLRSLVVHGDPQIVDQHPVLRGTQVIVQVMRSTRLPL